jgi:hypothetical protein
VIRSRISALFAKSEQTSNIGTLDKIRWKFKRISPLLGRQGIMAIGLLSLCIPFYFSTLRPMQLSLQELRINLKSIQDPTSKKANINLSVSPVEQLAEFYEFFPPEEDSPHWLGLMMEIANKNGLVLKHGEYAVVRDSIGQLRRFKITLPVQGSYPQIRKYLAALIANIPSMSLEHVQFERKDISDTQLQAKIKLVLYLRQGS